MHLFDGDVTVFVGILTSNCFMLYWMDYNQLKLTYEQCIQEGDGRYQKAEGKIITKEAEIIRPSKGWINLKWWGEKTERVRSLQEKNSQSLTQRIKQMETW